MTRAPPELNLKIGPFSVSAKGTAAVRAIQRPVAIAVTLLVPAVLALAVYGLFHADVLGFVLRRWWP
jgi:hypothetical protein